MKISIRSIQKDIYQIDAEPTDFIGAIKSKIEQSQGFTPSLQKIIFSGKVLADDKTLESYGFRGETDYLVLIVAKKPKLFSGSSSPACSSEAHSPSSAPSTAAASMPTAEATLAAATLASSDSSSALAPVSPTPGAPIHAFGDTSFFPIGEALQSTISNMVDMGFEPDQVQRALRASYNNPDRAVEYLTTEIPAHLDAEASVAVQVSPASAPVTPASDQAQNLFQCGTGLGAPVAGSSRDPQLEQFRQHLMQNPEPFLRFLAVQNPQMAQAFTANPEVLVQLLAAVGSSEGEEGPLPSAQVINVQGEDRVAIERVAGSLGFPRPAAIEAYFLAANYLLENGF
ncbi:hypothetical protein B0H13DRAFT_2232812 [Mycena leptocephala]|nr:hypothetical protein B0H13DRAFT_2232812 [Mycena leptocephala]